MQEPCIRTNMILKIVRANNLSNFVALNNFHFGGGICSLVRSGFKSGAYRTGYAQQSSGSTTFLWRVKVLNHVNTSSNIVNLKKKKNAYQYCI